MEEYKRRSPGNNLGHYGITVMKERSELIGADFYITSTVGQGTRVDLTLTNITEVQDERQARLEAEKSLKEREESFKTLVDRASYGILMADEEENIIYANAQAAAISGYSTIELKNAKVSKLALPLEYQRMLNWRPEQDRTQPVQQLFETNIQNKNGDEVPIELTIAQTIWNGKTVGMALFSDNSQHKNLEIALKESTENFKKLFDNAMDGIVLADNNGNHVYVNHSFAEITGYSISELLNMSMAHVIDPKAIKHLSKTLRDRISGMSSPAPYETSIIKKNGTRVPIVGMSTRITWQGQVVAMGFVRDISIQKQTVEALRQSEEKFKVLVDNAKDGILIADDSGNHIYANQKAAEITGYGISELMMTTIEDLAHPDEYDNLIKRFRSRVGGENPKEQYETRIITKNGDELFIEITAALTSWDDNPCVIVVMRDISERKLSEDFSYLFEQIYSVTNDAIAISDSENRLIYINKAHEKLFGWRFGEAIGVYFMDYCTAESRTILVDDVLPKLERGDTWEGVLHVLNRDRHVFPVKMVAGSVHDQAGKISYSYAIMKEKT
jgi:PAS domain S-box-containing protein